jgi:hypothetical protein
MVKFPFVVFGWYIFEVQGSAFRVKLKIRRTEILNLRFFNLGTQNPEPLNR